MPKRVARSGDQRPVQSFPSASRRPHTCRPAAVPAAKGVVSSAQRIPKCLSLQHLFEGVKFMVGKTPWLGTYYRCSSKVKYHVLDYTLDSRCSWTRAFLGSLARTLWMHEM
jgi:hypothetical protein